MRSYGLACSITFEGSEYDNGLHMDSNMLDQWLVNSLLDRNYIENIKLLGYCNFKNGRRGIFK